MNNILQQLYVQGKDGMVPIYINNKHIEVNNLSDVTEEFLNNNYSEYAVVIDRGNGNVYEQYEVGKWSGVKEVGPTPNIYVFTVDKTRVSFDTTGGSDNVTITSTKNGAPIGYEIASKPDWISFNGETVAVDVNHSEYSRTDTIIITQNESGKIIIITVEQAGISEDVYELSVNPTTVNVGATSNTSVIEVTSTKNGSEIYAEVINELNWVHTTII